LHCVRDGDRQHKRVIAMTSKHPQAPAKVLAKIRIACRGLPEVREESAWVGVRWRVRTKTFAHVLMIANGWPPAYAEAAGTTGPACVLTFRSWGRTFEPEMFDRRPFFRPRWFANIVGVAIDAETDWAILREHIALSYRTMAPKALLKTLTADKSSARGT